MNTFRLSAAFLALSFVALAPAWADWNIGDPYKMHYPQLPDPNGWDVNSTYYIGVADDWLCTGSGPVTDIHAWFSWRGDQDATPEFVHVQIWSDDRSGQFSKPGQPLWHKDFSAEDPNLKVRFWGQGDQGWYDPSTGSFVQHDHQNIFQLNVLIDPTEAFVQEQGNIYWLELSVKFPLGTPPNIQVGWKTSISPQFEDDAVWREITMGAPNWREIREPITGKSLDMAFVITPEPNTLVLLLGAGLMVLALRRLRTKG